jgi:septal ring factor EnvC (AmiA/AmiB activator)
MSSELITQILLGLLASIWIGDFVKGLFQKPKVKSDAKLSEANATQVLVGTATEMLEPLSRRVKEAEDEAKNLRQELRAAREEVSKLVTQLQECTAENKRVTSENKRLRARLA